MTDRSIEEELAHLRRASDDLSEVVAEQARRIDVLERRVALLMEHAAAQEEAGTGGVIVADEAPPHY